MKKKSSPAASKSCQKMPILPNDLIENLRQMIEETRNSIALTINVGITSLY